MAPAAVSLKKFFASREIRAAVGKLDARFGSVGNSGDEQDNRQGPLHAVYLISVRKPQCAASAFQLHPQWHEKPANERQLAVRGFGRRLRFNSTTASACRRRHLFRVRSEG